MNLRSASRDPVVVAAAALYVLLALPLLVPGLSADTRRIYSETSTTAPFLLLAISVYLRRRRDAAPAARRFWRLLAAGLLCWLGQQALLVVTWTQPESQWISILEDVAYAGLYFFFVLALDAHPHLPADADERAGLASLRRSGSVVFVFGLLVYLVLIPAAAAPEDAWSQLPSFTLYLVLDGYLLLRAIGLVRRTTERAWRPVYAVLAATFAAWLVLDSTEALMWADILPWTDSGTAWDLPWMVPLVLLVVAGRAGAPGETRSELAEPEGGLPADALSSGGSLIGIALLVPLLHLMVYGTGLFGPSTRRAHETTALVLLATLGALLFAYQRRIERRNRRLEAERREALALVEHQAHHDPLTGLPNRRLLSDRLVQALAQAARRGERLALFFFDLDDFKAVNDSRGHAFGDQLLRLIGGRLGELVRAGDTLARIGGDEFVILAANIGSRAAAADLAERFLARLAEPIEIAGESFSFHASVGVALYPDDGGDERTLLQAADAAMYAVKQSRRRASNG